MVLKMHSVKSPTTQWLDMRAVHSVPYIWPVVILFSNLASSSIPCQFSLIGFYWEVVGGRMVSMCIFRPSMEPQKYKTNERSKQYNNNNFKKQNCMSENTIKKSEKATFILCQ